jgi:hypothetical protein
MRCTSRRRLQLPAEDSRWVEFRLADSAWRADAASPDDDPARREKPRSVLEGLLAGTEQDRIRAEANESLGDYEATHPPRSAEVRRPKVQRVVVVLGALRLAGDLFEQLEDPLHGWPASGRW